MLVREVSASFNRNLEVKNLSTENLVVNLNPIILKRVKVNAINEISFRKGFNALDSIEVIPDSITISGPSEILKSINSIQTEPISSRNVDKNLIETVKIQSPSDEVVAINPKEVTVKLNVAEFSQVEYILPIEVINLPPNVEIKLVPKTITITFDIGVEEFSLISRENFRLVCDYSKRNKEENFLIPQLDKKPKGAVNVHFNPKKVDFLIFE